MVEIVKITASKDMSALIQNKKEALKMASTFDRYWFLVVLKGQSSARDKEDKSLEASKVSS